MSDDVTIRLTLHAGARIQLIRMRFAVHANCMFGTSDSPGTGPEGRF